MPETEFPETPESADCESAGLALPLLPLTTGVVLPQMVVTLAAESAEARDAADGAIGADRRVLLVPRVGTGYTRVGTVARIENEGELPGGQRALVLRGLSRALVGRTVPSDRPGLWVEVDPVAEPSQVSARAKEMVREYRAIVRGIAEKLGNPRIADALAGVDDPGALADTAGWAPDLAVERKVELLEELDPEGAPGEGVGLRPRDPGRARPVGADPQPRDRGDGQDAARVHAAPAAPRDP